MSKITASALELIGGTPLLKADRYADKAGVKDATILTKLEYLNPAGSVKDRIALAMIEDAEKKGQLKPGSTIIDQQVVTQESVLHPSQQRRIQNHPHYAGDYEY